VLDLRYNGGGAVSVAEVLGNLLGGIVANGEVFLRLVHNAENSFRNTTTFFTPETHSLDLRQIVIITTGATASASEIIINSLAPQAPHIDVVTVGATTFGKPVIQLAFPFCGKIFLPVTAQGLNADDEGDFFDGIPADCPAADDLDFALGDPAEASLAEALFYLEQGACSVMSAAAKQPPASRRGVTSRSQDRHHPLQPPPDAYF
ncbi:MAG: S41 family peptidase, partial [Candidatus Tectomicrobia bacterium]